MQISSSLNVQSIMNKYNIKRETQDNSSVTQISGRLDTMEKKYSGVFKPYEAFGRQKADEQISKKYPFHLSEEEFHTKILHYLKKVGVSEEEHAKSVKSIKEKVAMYDKLDEKTKQEYRAYQDEIYGNYGITEDLSSITLNTKKAKFLNAAVYEGLEQGRSLKEAKELAIKATNLFASLSPEGEYERALQRRKIDPNKIKTVYVDPYKYLQNLHSPKNDKYMAEQLLNEIKNYEKLLGNTDDEELKSLKLTQSLLQKYNFADISFDISA